MARPSVLSGLSISQLEKIISKRRSKLGSLTKKRTKILKQLADIDAKIVAAGGSAKGGKGAGTRPRNEVSLNEAIHNFLKKSAGPNSIQDIVDGVSASGYRSGSDNFRGIVNQTLIKDKRFAKGETRGTYLLKK